MQADQIWQTALAELQLQLTGATYDTWLGTSSLVACENGLFTIGVQSDHAKAWLENRLHGTIKRTLDGIVGQPVEVQFVVWKRSQNGNGLQPEGDGEAGSENGQGAGEPASPTPTEPIPNPSKGFIKLYGYEVRFWYPVLGRIAWRVIEIARELDKRASKTEWTPAKRWTAPALADQVPCGKQALTGVNRGEGENAVRRPGAFDRLAEFGVARIEKRGQLPRLTYWISVRNRLPLLSPEWVKRLPATLQMEHDEWLEAHNLDPKAWDVQENVNDSV